MPKPEAVQENQLAVQLAPEYRWLPLDAGAEEGKMIPLTTLLFGDSVRPPRS